MSVVDRVEAVYGDPDNFVLAIPYARLQKSLLLSGRAAIFHYGLLLRVGALLEVMEEKKNVTPSSNN